MEEPRSVGPNRPLPQWFQVLRFPVKRALDYAAEHRARDLALMFAVYSLQPLRPDLRISRREKRGLDLMERDSAMQGG